MQVIVSDETGSKFYIPIWGLFGPAFLLQQQSEESYASRVDSKIKRAIYFALLLLGINIVFWDQLEGVPLWGAVPITIVLGIVFTYLSFRRYPKVRFGFSKYCRLIAAVRTKTDLVIVSVIESTIMVFSIYWLYQNVYDPLSWGLLLVSSYLLAVDLCIVKEKMSHA